MKRYSTFQLRSLHSSFVKPCAW